MKQMPVYIAREFNVALNEGRRLWKNVENVIFTFTSECSKTNLTLLPHIIIIEKCNLSIYYKAYKGTRKMQIC